MTNAEECVQKIACPRCRQPKGEQCVAVGHMNYKRRRFVRAHRERRQWVARVLNEIEKDAPPRWLSYCNRCGHVLKLVQVSIRAGPPRKTEEGFECLGCGAKYRVNDAMTHKLVR